jgi:hypothetical protein
MRLVKVRYKNREPLLNNSYRILPTLPRLILAVGSSYESPNASLYTAVCFQSLFRLFLTIAGAINKRRSLSLKDIIRFKISAVCSFLFIIFTAVIILRVILLYYLKSRLFYLNFFISLDISINKAVFF